MKIYSLTNFSLPQGNVFFKVTEKNIVQNYCSSGPTSNHLFEFSNINSRIKCKICSKLTTETPDVAVVSLFLTLNIFDKLC